MSRLEQHNNPVCNAIRDSDRSYLIFVPIHTAIFFVMYFGITYYAVWWALWKANLKAHAAEASRRAADRLLAERQEPHAASNHDTSADHNGESAHVAQRWAALLKAGQVATWDERSEDDDKLAELQQLINKWSVAKQLDAQVTVIAPKDDQITAPYFTGSVVMERHIEHELNQLPASLLRRINTISSYSTLSLRGTTALTSLTVMTTVSVQFLVCLRFLLVPGIGVPGNEWVRWAGALCLVFPGIVPTKDPRERFGRGYIQVFTANCSTDSEDWCDKAVANFCHTWMFIVFVVASCVSMFMTADTIGYGCGCVCSVLFLVMIAAGAVSHLCPPEHKRTQERDDAPAGLWEKHENLPLFFHRDLADRRIDCVHGGSGSSLSGWLWQLTGDLDRAFSSCAGCLRHYDRSRCLVLCEGTEAGRLVSLRSSVEAGPNK
jgi:cbb3-type cytochrome oxidase subunit 3